MKDDVEVENLTRIYTDGVFIEVGTPEDNNNFVELRTTNANSKAYFGDIRFPMTPKFAMALGRTLTNKAIELGYTR